MKNHDMKDVSDLLVAPPTDYFETVPVSDLDNKVANSAPENQKRVEPKDMSKSTHSTSPKTDTDQPSLF